MIICTMPATAFVVKYSDATCRSKIVSYHGHHQMKKIPTKLMTSTTRTTTTQLHYDSQPEECLRIDTSPWEESNEALSSWLESVSSIERSEPDWLGEDLFKFSPALLLQEHLESLMGLRAPKLFPTEFSIVKFDFDWRACLLKSVPSQQLEEVLLRGRSNSHPLRLQLVAVPANTELPLHVHPAIELDIPLMGDLWERRSNISLPLDMLSRRVEHSLGTPLSDFSERPTAEELQLIHEDLSNRVMLPDLGMEGVFTTNKVEHGECLFNSIGSIHQSYSKDTPCLLWVLGGNVHAHFKPGNFHQRLGTSDLTGIDDLLE